MEGGARGCLLLTERLESNQRWHLLLCESMRNVSRDTVRRKDAILSAISGNPTNHNFV